MVTQAITVYVEGARKSRNHPRHKRISFGDKAIRIYACVSKDDVRRMVDERASPAGDRSSNKE